jgi:hypothetical protein
VNKIELLDQLFDARRELTRIIVGTADTQVPSDALAQLMTKRDQLNVQIQFLVLAEIKASIAQLDEARAAIGAATGDLKHLQSVAKDIQTGVSVAEKIVSVVGSLLTIV